jgi:hypothetical protein
MLLACYMFRTSYVHHQEDYVVHAALYGVFSLRLCKQSNRSKAAVTWILAQFICYRMHTQRRQSLHDYIDFMRRARWKYIEQYNFKCKVGNYLDVL